MASLNKTRSHKTENHQCKRDQTQNGNLLPAKRRGKSKIKNPKIKQNNHSCRQGFCIQNPKFSESGLGPKKSDADRRQKQRCSPDNGLINQTFQHFKGRQFMIKPSRLF